MEESNQPVSCATNPPTAARARIMRAIKGYGNATTELAFARRLRRARITGWRRHMKLPGRPDFAFPTAHVAVFVDGCFWHGCPHCYLPPHRNRAFWAEKLAANQRRDARVARKLRRLGWSVVRIWECKVNAPSAIERLLRVLSG